jgi:hypothetical protein
VSPSPPLASCPAGSLATWLRAWPPASCLVSWPARQRAGQPVGRPPAGRLAAIWLVDWPAGWPIWCLLAALQFRIDFAVLHISRSHMVLITQLQPRDKPPVGTCNSPNSANSYTSPVPIQVIRKFESGKPGRLLIEKGLGWAL